MNLHSLAVKSGPKTWLRLALALMVLLAISAPTGRSAAQSSRLNSAGLVIKHGNGTVLYFLVQFSEPEITGTQLLERAGVSIDETPYAGIGQAICRIDGEGCPSTDCFCKSFANPAVYWRYHKLGPDGNWVFLPSGPDARQVHDGDVDGWSWSSKDGDLPSVTLAQIAHINGITLTGTPTLASTSSVVATPLVSSPTPALVTATSASSPVVVGAEVKPSGLTTPVSPEPAKVHSDRTSYLLFGVGVLVLALLATVVVVRQRRQRL